ncbi:uncharacterized protein K444DRAFT_633123 [Hyaloscypha bicolor E]|uniref:Uncharacterized protein n=1 Tax=Hyaloscypha bicolor E TaxID=1095630 RepID=A0A2J6SZ29_9HELO|nr:uncharacterized protein K444DRAFT_633123 [Hyaloscypha bicolor E]PMD56022.1 hypothetical protein K444DRAFT_633123 [Hyaloscypha bicolor E]
MLHTHQARRRVEFKDCDHHIASSDNSLSKDSYIYQYHKLLKDAIDTMHPSYAPGPELKKWAEEAGKRLEPGTTSVSSRAKAVCMHMFTGVFGWSVEEVQVFPAKVRAESMDIKKDKVHSQYT